MRNAGKIEAEPFTSGGSEERIVLSEMADSLVDVAIAAEFGIVGRQHDIILASRGKDSITGERLGGIEVEYKHEVAAHVGKHLVVVLLPKFHDGK